MSHFSLKIVPHSIFNRTYPIMMGVEVLDGTVTASPVHLFRNGVNLGKIVYMEMNHAAVDSATIGQFITIKIEGTGPVPHFDYNDVLVSTVTAALTN
jgi:translation initiation factor IF-2